MQYRKDEITARVLETARATWEGASTLRLRRERYKRFTYGDQWCDMTVDSNGNRISEYELAIQKGRRPMTNNLIRRLVKCIVGRFRNRISDRGEPDPTLAPLYRHNSLDELDCRMLEEFLISGCAIQRVVSERRQSGEGVYVDNVSPDSFFINGIRDPRGWDTEIIGMVHRMSLPELTMRFARGDRQLAAELRRLYGEITCRLSYLNAPGSGQSKRNFFGDADGRCSVVEVWTLEAGERYRWHDPANASFGICSATQAEALIEENRLRAKRGEREIALKWEMTTRWHCRWIAPDGTLLDEYDSPYSHGSHPFVVKFYPLTDGEVHSLVEDVIDQQVHINRLITLLDHIMGTSAKGALLFPIEQKEANQSWQELSKIWSSPDGIIPYRGLTDRAEPKQISANCTDIGARELLALEMQMFEDVSGVSNALMGKVSGSGNVGAERFDNEVRNALVAISDLMMTYEGFLRSRDEKMAGA